MKKTVKKDRGKIIKSKTNLFVGLSIIAIAVALVLDYFDSKFSLHDIIVEYHGLVFDLFVFGIILTIYELRSSKRDKIDRYQEEIDDFRFWHSEEAQHRIKGLIKRLVDLGVSEINVAHCNFNDVHWFSEFKSSAIKWNFSGAQLKRTTFIWIPLIDSNLHFANLSEAIFIKIDFSNSNMEGANLIGCSFKKCDFSGVDFYHASVDSSDWFDKLESSENVGLEHLKQNFYIEPDGEHFKVYAHKDSSFFKPTVFFGADQLNL